MLSSGPSRAPTCDELQGLLDKIIACLMNMLTHQGHLIEEQDMTYPIQTMARAPTTFTFVRLAL